MARIAGVNIPENKHVEISLTHIFGIGRKTAQNICKALKIDFTRKISDLSEEEIEAIRNAVSEHVVEGDLRRNISTNIKRLMDFMSQVQSHMMSSQYASLMKKANLKNYRR